MFFNETGIWIAVTHIYYHVRQGPRSNSAAIAISACPVMRYASHDRNSHGSAATQKPCANISGLAAHAQAIPALTPNISMQRWIVPRMPSLAIDTGSIYNEAQCTCFTRQPYSTLQPQVASMWVPHGRSQGSPTQQRSLLGRIVVGVKHAE